MTPTVTKVEHFSILLCHVACRRVNFYMDELKISHPRISLVGCAAGWQAIVASLHKFHRKRTEREGRHLDTWNIQLESNEVVFLSVSIQDNNRSTSTERINPGVSTPSLHPLVCFYETVTEIAPHFSADCLNVAISIQEFLAFWWSCFNRYLVKNRKNVHNSLSRQINGPYSLLWIQKNGNGSGPAKAKYQHCCLSGFLHIVH